jgi:hypothetical protein
MPPCIHLQARLEDEKQCILVLIGATPEGRKELIGFAASGLAILFGLQAAINISVNLK